MGQVGLCGDWKVHSHTGVPSQIGTAQLLGRGEGPGWEMESERARAWVGPGHTQLYCLEELGKEGWQMDLAARGAWVLPDLQPINSVILGRSLNFSSDQCPCL